MANQFHNNFLVRKNPESPLSKAEWEPLKPKESSGWHQEAPIRRSERIAMKNNANHCFLKPGNLKYPICPKKSKTVSTEGIVAAFERARIENDLDVLKELLKRNYLKLVKE